MSSTTTGTTTPGIRKVATDPDWYEPYRISQAVRAGGFVYVSGQAGFEEDGATVEGGFLAQGRQAFRNVGRVLDAAGLAFTDVVKVGIFVRGMAENLPHVITSARSSSPSPTRRTPSSRSSRWLSPTGRSRSR
ncbi:RidA family protein [Streptomyces sp. NPDC001941]|uniref:RidA family protein n=1 Tax=Streptomyces sp. NPDC001941 TaxID=3154659 RepID=UPI00331C576C